MSNTPEQAIAATKSEAAPEEKSNALHDDVMKAGTQREHANDEDENEVPNDSEAETEILSRRQTPRKPGALDMSTVKEDAKSPTTDKPDPTKAASSPLSSPKKRKAEELTGQDAAWNATTSDDDDDYVVSRVRSKRPRRVLQREKRASRGVSEDVAAGDKDSNEESEKMSRREASVGESHGKHSKNSLSALDLSASADNVAKLDGASDQTGLHSPRLRSKLHRRSISHHPSAQSGQDMSARKFTKMSSRGSEGPSGERSCMYLVT